jgi:hypothetical protein
MENPLSAKDVEYAGYVDLFPSTCLFEIGKVISNELITKRNKETRI